MKFTDLMKIINDFNEKSKKHWLMAWETSMGVMIEVFDLMTGKSLRHETFNNVEKAIREVRLTDDGRIAIDSLWRLT